MRDITKNGFVLSFAAASFFILVTGCGGDFSYNRGGNFNEISVQKSPCYNGVPMESESVHCVRIDEAIKLDAGKPRTKEDGPGVILNLDKDVPVTTENMMAEVVLNDVDVVKIESWWQAGAPHDKLLADGDNCASELGEGHERSGNMSIVTRALLDCMRGKSWLARESDVHSVTPE